MCLLVSTSVSVVQAKNAMLRAEPTSEAHIVSVRERSSTDRIAFDWYSSWGSASSTTSIVLVTVKVNAGSVSDADVATGPAPVTQ